MSAKNMVMFSIDDMRTLDDWGHFTPLISTPNIDRLMEMGTTFDRAITQVPLCNPSRTSVFTGRAPSETGVLDNAIPWYERSDPAETLPAVLKAAGVHVAMYGKHFHGHPISPEDQAVMFDDFRTFGGEGGGGQILDDDVRHESPFPTGRYVGPAEDLRDQATADAAVAFLRDQAGALDQPFFLGVGIVKPHLSWVVPAEFYDRYDPAAIRAALEASLNDGTIIPGDGEYFDVPTTTRPSPEHVEISADADLWVDYIHGYLAAVSYADARIGEVLDALAADPALAAETGILLWSDHGYHLGDKDSWGKFTQWKEATEVPFVIVDPEAPGGQVADQVVSLVDIFPTVLDLMGLVPQGLGLSGSSLVPIVRDAGVDWYDPAAGKGVALTTVFGSVSLRADIPGVGDLRYTRHPDGTEELYNITDDPNEHVNRIDFSTLVGLTPADDALRATVGALMDAQLTRVGMLTGDGVTPLVGTAASELLVSSALSGPNEMAGGDGDDTYVLYADAAVTEADDGGFDAVVIANPDLEATFRLPRNVEMVQVTHDFTGNGADNIIFGQASGTLGGRGGDDRITGGDGDQVIRGGAGDDLLEGGGGADALVGSDGRDTLNGGKDDDRLLGGADADRLTGGEGRDIFDFRRAEQSSPAASDTITDFEGAGAARGDRIDLSAIDADPDTPGDQAFRLGVQGSGGVAFVENDGDTVLVADAGDGAPRVRIVLADGATPSAAYTEADLIL